LSVARIAQHKEQGANPCEIGALPVERCGELSRILSVAPTPHDANAVPEQLGAALETQVPGGTPPPTMRTQGAQCSRCQALLWAVLRRAKRGKRRAKRAGKCCQALFWALRGAPAMLMGPFWAVPSTFALDQCCQAPFRTVPRGPRSS